MSLKFTLPQFSQYTIHIHKFKSITNTAEIKTQLLSANPAYDFAFINPKAIISLEQINSAVYRALLDHTAGSAKTKSIHSEVVFALGSGNKIGENLVRFGIADDSEELIVVKIVEGNATYELADVVFHGQEVTVTEETISESYDLQTLKKNYKIDSDSTQVEYLTRFIVNAIQLRGH
jgi:EKC/KEOPS complex subunit CGI121/TPRKB